MKYVIIARSANWTAGFACQATMAETVVEALNASEENGNWEVVTIPIHANEVIPTIQSWMDSGIA